MARLDDRLREDIERAARPADPSGLYEDLIRRRERRRIGQRVQTGAVALVVVIGTIAGFYGLSRIFRTDQDRPAAGTVANGLIALTLFSYDPGSPTGPQHHIYTISPDGTGLTQVTSADVLDTSVAWSPDGRQIAFWRAKVPRPGVWVVEADGSDPRLLLETQMSIGAIHWSPDGARIAFIGIEVAGVSGTGLDFPTHLYVMTAEGANLTQVTDEGQVTDFAWSPAGERFVVERQFDAGDDRLGYDLSILDVDGGGETPITSDGVSRDPSWSPDGSTIVFVGSDSGTFRDPDLFAIAPDGSELRQLTRDGAALEDPTWSPDGTGIALTRAPDGDGSSCELVVMSADGSSATTIADKRSLGGCPLDLAWQPVLDGEVVEPFPSETPTPSATPTPTPTIGEDFGLGFPVCNVSSIIGRFAAPDQRSTAFVATRASDAGACPEPGDASNILALDVDRDGTADGSYGPIECTLGCRTFSAPDIDGDGTDELLVVQDDGAVVGLRVYDFAREGQEIVPVAVAAPGDPGGGFLPGDQAVLWLGGDAFELYALSCGEVPAPDGPGVIATAAESLPHDSIDARWHAHQTTMVLRSDGLLYVVDTRDFTEPVSPGPDGPSFGSGETLCGSNLGP